MKDQKQLHLVDKMERHDEPQFVLGESGTARKKSIVIKGKALDKGFLISGATSSGKTTGVVEPLIDHVVRHPAMPGLVTYDTKDGYAERVMEIARAAGQVDRVRVLTPGGPWRMNILDPNISSNKLAEMLINAVLAPGEQNHPVNGFWVQQAIMRLANAIEFAREEKGADNVTLSDVAQFFTLLCIEPPDVAGISGETNADKLSKKGLFKNVNERLAASKLDNPDHERVVYEAKHLKMDIMRFANLDERPRTSIVVEIERVLHATRPYDIARTFGAPNAEANFSIRDVAEQGLIVVVDVPQQKHGLVGRVLTAMIRRSLNTYLIKSRSGKDLRTLRPVYQIMDEAQNILSYDEAPESDVFFSSVARSLGCRLVVATQSVTSLYASAGDGNRSKVDTLIGNLRNHVHLRQDIHRDLGDLLDSRGVAPMRVFSLALVPSFSGIVLTDEHGFDFVRLKPFFDKGKERMRTPFSMDPRVLRREKAFSEAAKVLQQDGLQVRNGRSRFIVGTAEKAVATKTLDVVETSCRTNDVPVVRLDGKMLGQVDPFQTLLNEVRQRVRDAEAGVILVDRLDLAEISDAGKQFVLNLIHDSRIPTPVFNTPLETGRVVVVFSVVQQRRRAVGLQLPGDEARCSRIRVPEELRGRVQVVDMDPAPATKSRRAAMRGRDVGEVL